MEICGRFRQRRSHAGSVCAIPDHRRWACASRCGMADLVLAAAAGSAGATFRDLQASHIATAVRSTRSSNSGKQTTIVGRHSAAENTFRRAPPIVQRARGGYVIDRPRPLLPRDQPANPGVRLMIRPGITGWAQVNGGTLLTPSPKDALDDWYVRNASFLLDLRMILKTAQVHALGQARADGVAATRQFLHPADELPAPLCAATGQARRRLNGRGGKVRSSI